MAYTKSRSFCIRKLWLSLQPIHHWPRASLCRLSQVHKWRQRWNRLVLCPTQDMSQLSCQANDNTLQRILKYWTFKGSSYPSHLIFEINVGKRRIGHRTTPKFKIDSKWIKESSMKMASFEFEVVLYRIRLFPTLISKINWPELPLRIFWTRLTRFLWLEN